MLEKLLEIPDLWREWRAEVRCRREGHTSLVEHRWTAPDGTPMMTQRCRSCGYFDKGPIYANDGSPNK